MTLSTTLKLALLAALLAGAARAQLPVDCAPRQ